MAKIVSNIENTHMYSTRNEPIEKINCVDDRFITDSVCYSAVRIAEKQMQKQL